MSCDRSEKFLPGPCRANGGGHFSSVLTIQEKVNVRDFDTQHLHSRYKSCRGIICSDRGESSLSRTPEDGVVSRGPGINQRSLLVSASERDGAWVALSEATELWPDVASSAWRRAVHGLVDQALLDIAYAPFEDRRRVHIRTRTRTAEEDRRELLAHAFERSRWHEFQSLYGFRSQLTLDVDLTVAERDGSYDESRGLLEIDFALRLSADREGRVPYYPYLQSVLSRLQAAFQRSNLVLVDGVAQFDTWWRQKLLDMDPTDDSAVNELMGELRRNATARYRAELAPLSKRMFDEPRPARRAWLRDDERLREPTDDRAGHRMTRSS